MIVDSFLFNYEATYGAAALQEENGILATLEKLKADTLRKIVDMRVRLRALTEAAGRAGSGSGTSRGAPRQDPNEPPRGQSAEQATNADVWDLQLQLKLAEELYEETCRRLQELTSQQWTRPRVSLAHAAELKTIVDGRWTWTLIVLGATVLLSSILWIARAVLRRRPA